MKDKLNGEYRVKWRGDIYGIAKHESLFTYSQTDCLMHRFISTCNMIIDDIASVGHVATVEEMDVDNGVLIMERWPNDLTIIKTYSVLIEKED